MAKKLFTFGLLAMLVLCDGCQAVMEVVGEGAAAVVLPVLPLTNYEPPNTNHVVMGKLKT